MSLALQGSVCCPPALGGTQGSHLSPNGISEAAGWLGAVHSLGASPSTLWLIASLQMPKGSSSTHHPAGLQPDFANSLIRPQNLSRAGWALTGLKCGGKSG